MSKTTWLLSGMLAVGLTCVAALAAEPATKEDEEPTSRVSVELARDRAKMLHEVYVATLDVIHSRYFRGDRATIPARAMEDVFTEIRRRSKIDARWISVNLPPMSVDHEPKSDFEKQAAKELSTGKAEWEAVEGGYYRRAGAIRMGGDCVVCHGGFFREPPKTPKFSGLVISVPILEPAPQAK